MSIDIIPAEKWGRNVIGNPTKLRDSSIVELTVHYTGAPSVKVLKSRVPSYIKGTELGHQRKKSSTIAYNLIIDKWGRIWEGRGLGLRNAANGTYSNSSSVSVLLLVGVNDNEPTLEMVSSLQNLYKFLCARYSKKLDVRPHQYHKPTACPGPAVLRLISSGRIQGDVAVSQPAKPAAPTPVAPAPVAPAPVRDVTVVVVKGDSWWRLAAKHMGSGLRWLQLKKHNSDVKLIPGVTIRIPKRFAPAPVRDVTVVVVKGDSWWRLAAKHMGSGLRWLQLKKHNSDVKLIPGVTIRIPKR